MVDNTEKTKTVENVLDENKNPNVFRLKMEDISGTNSEVLTIYLYELNNFIRTHNLNKSEKMLYTSLQSALEYYKYISDTNSPFFTSVLDYTERETIALQKKFPGLDIKTSLRVKSPISAYNKILDKIQEYIVKGRDLKDLNSSLRDFIGIRRIISPKNALLNNPKKSALRTLEFAEMQLINQERVGCNIIPIRKEKIHAIEAFHPYQIDPETQEMYIPKHFEIPENLTDRFRYSVKNYIAYPKESLYQTLQYCTYLPFSKQYALEYQVRDTNMHKIAEEGQAKHTNYKVGFDTDKARFQTRFVRANTPIEYEFDQKTQKMIPYSLDKSLRIHKGYSFQDRFGISEEEFYENFTKEDQDRILSLKYSFMFDEKKQSYDVLPVQTVELASLIRTSPDALHETLNNNDPKHSDFDDR